MKMEMSFAKLPRDGVVGDSTRVSVWKRRRALYVPRGATIYGNSVPLIQLKRILSVIAVIFPLRHRLSFLLEKDNRSVHLVSQEGESFDIKVSVAKMSNLVKTMIDGTCRLVP